MFSKVTNMLGALAKQDRTPNEQLLKLYWNRADVKRELNSLKRERFELLDRLKDQEGEIERAKEQLDGLERLLVNPVAAANAMVYFQLRHLWRVAAKRLEQFAADLEQKCEAHERKQLQDAASAKRRRRLDAVNNNWAALKKKRKAVAAEAGALVEKLENLNPIMRFFRAGRMRADIHRIRRHQLELDEKLTELEHLADRIQGEPLPEPEGLSIESRRYINTSVIALAQHLTLHFAANNLAAQALSATHRTVGDMKFGNRRECDRMVECIRDRIADLKQEKHITKLVMRRAKHLASEFSYRNQTDAAPSSFSTPTITPIPSGDNRGRRSADEPLRINVLADDYWDLGSFLR